ncbi:MAG: type II secretion system F family protein [Anaerolineae bacterium]
MAESTIMQISYFVSLLTGLSALAFWVGLRRRSRVDDIMERLRSRPDRQRVPEALEMEQPFVDRVVKPAGRRLARRLGRMMPHRNIERLQRDLESAGRPHDFTVSDFLGLRVIVAVITACGTTLLLRARGLPIITTLLFGLAAGLMGSLLPRFWLRRQVRARQSAIQRALPDALDMLTIAVAAGLGFDGAIQMISDRWDNALAEEFGQVIREIRVGIPRTEALRNLARRANIKEMSNFIAVIVQADHLGLSISKVLEAQSSQMRLLRRQRAEEQAQQAPLKMLFPLIFLIFPAMFVVILGPAVPMILEAFGS